MLQLNNFTFIFQDVQSELDAIKSTLHSVTGNHLLSEQDLDEFYFKACGVTGADELRKMKVNDVIRKVVEFVRNLPSVENLDVVGAEVFG